MKQLRSRRAGVSPPAMSPKVWLRLLLRTGSALVQAGLGRHGGPLVPVTLFSVVRRSAFAPSHVCPYVRQAVRKWPDRFEQPCLVTSSGQGVNSRSVRRLPGDLGIAGWGQVWEIPFLRDVGTGLPLLAPSSQGRGRLVSGFPLEDLPGGFLLSFSTVWTAGIGVVRGLLDPVRSLLSLLSEHAEYPCLWVNRLPVL